MICDSRKLIHGGLLLVPLGWMIRTLFILLIVLLFSSNTIASSTPPSSSPWWSSTSNNKNNKNGSRGGYDYDSPPPDYNINDYNNDEEPNDYSVPEISITDAHQPQPYYDDETEEWQQRQQQKQRPPPPPPLPGYAPPPPPPPSESSSSFAQQAQESKYNPIHYQFQSKSATSSSSSSSQFDNSADNDGIPQTFRPGDNDENNNIMLHSRNDPRKGITTARGRRQNMNDLSFASPRQDAITRFMSRGIRARLLLHCSSGTVGVIIGLFLIKSFFSSSVTSNISSTTIAIWFISFFSISIICRNAYGEWVRALGLTLLWTMQRSYQMRRQHPVAPHVKALLRIAPRRPFPPLFDENQSLWTYQPSNNNHDNEDEVADVDFSMWQCLISMALIGSFCGGHVPLLPSWMGGLAGAGAFCAATTYNQGGSTAALGDLARTMGMRVSQLARISWQTQAQLKLLPKTATVATKVLDKLLVLDRKHSIRDKIVTMLSWVYDQARNTANQMQSSQQQPQPQQRGPPPGEYNRRGPPSSRRGGRPPPQPPTRARVDDEEEEEENDNELTRPSPPAQRQRPPQRGPPLQRRPPPRGEEQYSRPDRNFDADNEYYQEPPRP